MQAIEIIFIHNTPMHYLFHVLDVYKRQLHKREAFLCNQLIKQTELFNKLKTTKYIDLSLIHI